MKRTVLIAGALVALAAEADVLSDARALMDDGDYSAALAILGEDLTSGVKSSQLGTLNQLAGECAFHLGDNEAARTFFRTAKSRGVADASLYLGRLDYLEYDFDSASDHYSTYFKLKQKGGKEVDPDAEMENDRIPAAISFLDRVEKIAVIDSLAVDRESFFKAYRLPVSAGSLVDPSQIPFEEGRQSADMAYRNERGDLMLWAQPDSVGDLRIVESIMLTDGQWHEPETAQLEVADGDTAWPFLMADGVTLYFANDGEDSIGGYDIFVAQRDGTGQQYLQPQNLGMPYNSPYDDYMLAIDELNGIGWWATDRNNLGDKITVYVFVPNDLRVNISPDDPDVVARARISDYKATWDDRDYDDLLKEIASIETGSSEKKADFHFPMSGGREYTSLKDFKTSGGRQAMTAYLRILEQYEESARSLAQMRRQYHSSPSAALGQRIAAAEKQTAALREKCDKARSDVYRAER